MNQNPTPISLDGATVAITGGARGIGLEAAKIFHARGANVVLGDLDGQSVADAAAAVGPRAHGHLLDVADRDSFAAFLLAAEDLAGPVDVLVNNAGVMPVGPFLKTSDRLIDTQLDVNLRGPITGMRLALPKMIARRRGHVINVASMTGKFPIPGLAVYSSTKHAVVGLSAAVRDELDGTGVSISTVMPNAVRTELTRGLPTERIGILSPEQVAMAIVDSVDNRREEIAIPRWYGIWPLVPVLLPTRLIARVKKIFGSHRLLEQHRIDREARERYDEQVSAAGSRATAKADK